ncbi:MAG: protein kinase [Gemmatimonadota bacterium]
MSTADQGVPPEVTGLTAQWARLSPVLDRLLDTSPEHRDLVLDELAGGDTARRAELVAMLRDCEDDASFLEAGVTDSFASLIAHEPAAALPAVLGDRYQIQHEIGRGGMARVYLARDLRHDRDVAVKVLRHDLAMSLGAERFLREISICARLRHPNIVPLFDSGEADGQLFYVMPYERGASLRARIESAPLMPLPEALGILRDIARALEYAHGEGVVHRDIKPENVMLSGGAAVVTDFGIAKAISASQAVESPTVAPSGGTIGTPAYMAPEQAAGDPATDHRADLYAFGCLAYELLTGRRVYELLGAADAPLPTVRAVRPEVAENVSAMIAHCLARRATDRPRDAATVRAALANADDAARLGDEAPADASLARWRGARRTLLTLAALVVTVGAGALVARNRSASVATPTGASAERTLIVLPMENDASDSLAYLASGLADDIARRLVGIGGIRVSSGARSDWPAATRRDINAIGRAFDATIVLRTRLGRHADSLEIQTEVANVTTGQRRQVRTHRFASDRAAGAAAVVAASVAGALFQASNPHMPRQSVARIDEESYRLTHRAWWMNLTPVDSAQRLFEAAIRLDPSNARAYAGLSATWAKSGNSGAVAFDEAYRNATAAARRALAVDSTEGSAMAQLAVMETYQSRSLAVGLAWLDKAKRVDPSNAEVFQLEAMLYRMSGQFDKAIDAVRVSSELDPLNPTLKAEIGHLLICADRLQEAGAHFDEWSANEPRSVAVSDGRQRVLIYQGRYDQAIAAWRLAVPVADTALASRLTHAAGRQGYWNVKHFVAQRELLRAGARRSNSREAHGIALAAQLIQTGELDRGLALLAEEVRRNSPILLRRLSCAGPYDEIRDDPRFQRLRAQVGVLR